MELIIQGSYIISVVLYVYRCNFVVVFKWFFYTFLTGLCYLPYCRQLSSSFKYLSYVSIHNNFQPVETLLDTIGFIYNFNHMHH